jgi:hypothetical protein
MTACVAELKPFRQFIERLRLFWVPRHQKAIRKIASKMAQNGRCPCFLREKKEGAAKFHFCPSSIFVHAVEMLDLKNGSSCHLPQ